MSTKALGRLIEGVRDVAGCARSVMPDMICLHCVAGEAEVELEAIRKMARDWVEVGGQPGPGRMKRLDELLRAIAEEEP